MDIVTFARLHGVLIDRLIEDGKWHRVPTEERPKKRNGAYMSRGAYGFVQDHGNHTEAILWRPDENEVQQVDRAAMQRRIDAAAAQLRKDQEAAAKRAGWIMHQCTVGGHPYLVSKGFPEEVGYVWRDDRVGDLKLCIPMSADGKIVGVQTISDQPEHERTDRDGDPVTVPAFEKRFLYGQRINEAVKVLGTPKGAKVFCEGYATALSVRRALQGIRQPYALFVCFTAGNMVKVARNHGSGIVIADNDLPSKQHAEYGGHGLAVAKQIGLPFWLSDRAGEDFNDYEQRLGVFRSGQALRPLFLRRPTP